MFIRRGFIALGLLAAVLVGTVTLGSLAAPADPDGAMRRSAPAKFTAETFDGRAFQLRGPKGYDGTQSYPLLVYLHGGGANGADSQKALAAAPAAVKEDALQERHPTFVYIPQCPEGGSWDAPAARTMVVKTIGHLTQVYRIDPQRIYLAGFSMGGSGSYFIAKHYHDATGKTFAAVARCAGQSDYPPETHAVLAKGAVWIHIGKQDSPQRCRLARDSYEQLRKLHYPEAGAAEQHETKEDLTIATAAKTYRGQTRTLVKDGKAVARITEYDDEGHTTTDFPFRNPQVFEWLFAQKAR